MSVRTPGPDTAPFGVWGIETCGTFPIGEHAHGPYNVSTTDTVVLPLPLSDFTVRPNPSSVFFTHRPFVVAVTVHGAELE